MRVTDGGQEEATGTPGERGGRAVRNRSAVAALLFATGPPWPVFSPPQAVQATPGEFRPGAKLHNVIHNPADAASQSGGVP